MQLPLKFARVLCKVSGCGRHAGGEKGVGEARVVQFLGIGIGHGGALVCAGGEVKVGLPVVVTPPAVTSVSAVMVALPRRWIALGLCRIRDERHSLGILQTDRDCLVNDIACRSCPRRGRRLGPAPRWPRQPACRS